MAEETQLKTYKVLKRLGWGGGTYLPDDTVEMPEDWGNYYVKEKVLEEMATQDELPRGLIALPHDATARLQATAIPEVEEANTPLVETSTTTTPEDVLLTEDEEE